MTDSWNSLGRKKFEFILAYQFLFVSTFHYLSFRTEADSVFYFFNFPLLLLSLEVLILLIKNKNIKKQEKNTKMVACAAGGFVSAQKHQESEPHQSALWANSWIDRRPTWFFGLCLMLSGLRNFVVDCHI